MGGRSSGTGEAVRVILKMAAWAGLVALLWGGMFGVFAGVVLWAGLVLAAVWYHVADGTRLDEAGVIAGCFALAGTGFSVSFALGIRSLGILLVFGGFTVLLSLVVWATWDYPGSDLGGPTD